ncbi:S26 family signal peptidase [Actinospica robiniae]|uniref:S26 family signal peptidase n=1 Tax=Actinospica robiniae TaxID=304901 RepID=UPI0006854F1C|nr:S26 family signal peptidase [Actinospica robiniae]
MTLVGRSGLPTVAAIVCVAAAGAWARRRLLVVTVSGESMLPTLAEGDRFLARRGTGRLAVGDIVVIEPGDLAPLIGRGLMVKRVAALAGDPVPVRLHGTRGEFDPSARVPEGEMIVLGDGVRSFDSRNYGFFDRQGAVAVLFARMPRRPGVARQARFRLRSKLEGEH